MNSLRLLSAKFGILLKSSREVFKSEGADCNLSVLFFLTPKLQYAKSVMLEGEKNGGASSNRLG